VSKIVCVYLVNTLIIIYCVPFIGGYDITKPISNAMIVKISVKRIMGSVNSHCPVIVMCDELCASASLCRDN